MFFTKHLICIYYFYYIVFQRIISIMRLYKTHFYVCKDI